MEPGQGGAGEFVFERYDTLAIKFLHLRGGVVQPLCGCIYFSHAHSSQVMIIGFKVPDDKHADWAVCHLLMPMLWDDHGWHPL